METFGVATVVQPSLLDSSAASASVGSAFLASTLTTKTSTLATSENGNGVSVRRTVRRPVPVPEESLQAASATVAITKAAKSRMVLLILVSPAKGLNEFAWDLEFACRARPHLARLRGHRQKSQLIDEWESMRKGGRR